MEKKNLLIFESDSDYASMLKKAFLEYGFNVLIAKTESNFQEHLGLDTIDLFIIRAENPYVNGFLLCKKIRDMKGYKTTPILLLSSAADDATLQKHKSFAFAADFYIKLPKEMEEILVAAHSLLPFIDGIDAPDEEIAEVTPIDVDDENDLELTLEPTVLAPAPMDAPKEEVIILEKDSSGADELEQAFLSVSQENEDLQLELDLLKKKLAEIDKKPNQQPDNSAELKSIKDELQMLKNKNAELSAEREKFLGEQGELKNALAQKSLQIDNLRKTMEEMEEIAEGVGSGASSAEFENLKNDFDKQRKEIELHKKELEFLKNANGKLDIEKSDLVDELNSSKKELESLQAKIHELETTPATPKSELEKQLIDLRDENEDLKLINKNMKVRVREVESEIEKTKEDTDIQLGKIKEERREFEELKNEMKELISQLENDKAELFNEKETMEQLAGELKIATEDLNIALEEKNQTILELEEKCAESRTNIVELKEKLADLIDIKENYSNMKTEKESLEKNIEGRIKELERLSGIISSKEAELSKHAEMVKVFTIEKDNMIKELENKAHTIQAITSQKDEVEKHYREAHARAEKLNQSLNSLKNVVENIKKTVNSIEL